MAALIVLNGPPGVGKSTLAQRYVAEHPFALDLDLDPIRRAIGGWRDDPAAAGLRARALSLVMAADHLAAGHDAVVPQYLGRPEFLRQLEQVAASAGAAFVEFVLMDDRDTVVRRFHDRTAVASAVSDAHRDAAAMFARFGGDDALFAMYDRLLLMLAARPAARVLQCPDGAEDVVYRQIVSALQG